MKVIYRQFRPVTVLFARGIGPYASSATAAWDTMGGWLDGLNARSRMRISYGLFRDDPKTTAPELLRYDACIPLVMGLHENEVAGIRRQVLAGGAYAVFTHTGAIEATAEIFSKLYRTEIPRSGLRVDVERPFLSVYLTDPTVTRVTNRRTEVCVPVFPIRVPTAVNDQSTSWLAPAIAAVA